MCNEFTKHEAIRYLGEVFSFKTNFQEIINSEPKRQINAGEVGKVTSVDCWTGKIKLTLDVYGNYFTVDKFQFEKHCQILKPEIVSLVSEG